MGKVSICRQSSIKTKYIGGKELAQYIEWIASENTSIHSGLQKTADRKRKRLKGAELERFNQRLQDSAPPTPTSVKSQEAIYFIGKSANKAKTSMMGFAGLDRAEINLSYLNYRDEFFELTDLDDIRWAIEHLDESLSTYYNNKKKED